MAEAAIRLAPWRDLTDRLDQLQRSVSRATPVRAHTFVMGLLFGTALIVGYVLLPGDSERIAMLERDGKTTEAREILEARFNAGDRRQRTLFLLQGLYEQAGDLPKARTTLELLARQRPADVALQRQLATFYKQTHDEQAYVRSLLGLIDLRYTEAACRELVGIYRRQGAYAEEQAALGRCRQKGYRRPDDMVRLASLMAAGGDVREASNVLRAVDDLRRLKTDRERFQLFDLLLANDLPNEAQRRAARWVRGSKDDAFTLTLISSLLGARRPELAIELARETSVPGDSVFLSIPEVMVEQDQLLAARAILRGWLDQARVIDPEIAGRFVTAAISAGDIDLALAGAQRFGLPNLTLATRTDLARGLRASGRVGDAAAYVSPTANAVSPLPTADALNATPTKPIDFGGLDAWRGGLWKRLREANRPPVSAGSFRSLRAGRALTAVRRARTIRAFRPGGFKPKAPAATAFDLPFFP